jgi:hypothetical protein
MKANVVDAIFISLGFSVHSFNLFFCEWTSRRREWIDLGFGGKWRQHVELSRGTCSMSHHESRSSQRKWHFFDQTSSHENYDSFIIMLLRLPFNLLTTSHKHTFITTIPFHDGSFILFICSIYWGVEFDGTHNRKKKEITTTTTGVEEECSSAYVHVADVFKLTFCYYPFEGKLNILAPSNEKCNRVTFDITTSDRTATAPPPSLRLLSANRRKMSQLIYANFAYMQTAHAGHEIIVLAKWHACALPWQLWEAVMQFLRNLRNIATLQDFNGHLWFETKKSVMKKCQRRANMQNGSTRETREKFT